ncbi:MAG: phosphatase PAP2 family protein [Bacteroidia bacterium]|nr:phosphatase PAP2 family protein [Bacteroidia bacterium]
MNQFARIISSVFQPLLMPIYSILLLFVYTHFKLLFVNQFWTIITPVILFSFIIPGILIYAVYKLKLISDLSLKIRKERFIPYSIVLVSYLIMIFYYYRIGMPNWFFMLTASSIAVILIAIFITIWWKISAHMFGVGGLVGGVMSVSYFVERANPFYLFIALFLIAGLVGTSRLLLRRHTFGQVIAGFLLGFTISLLFVWIGTYI